MLILSFPDFFSVLHIISWFPVIGKYGFSSLTALLPSSQYILVSSILYLDSTLTVNIIHN